MGARGQDAGELVNWKTLGRDRFERVVEALIACQHPRGTRVDPVDGRGGDGGIDVLAIEPTEETGKAVIYRDEPGRVVVYQLKYLPDGFDGKHKGGRDQIKRSLEQAVRNVPSMDEWVLVAPCTATNTGYGFLDRLRAAHPGLTITFINRSILDGPGWVAGHPHVVSPLVTRGELVEEAKVLRHEKTVLAGGVRDLIERQQNLNRLTNKVDPHWTWRLMEVPGSPPVLTLYPKHPGAANVSPVSIGFKVDATSPAGAAFLKSQEFGSFEPIHLPGEAVRDFTVTGPEFVVDGLTHGETAHLELHPILAEHDPVPLTLAFLGAQGQVLKSTVGHARQVAAGTHGTTIRHEFFGGCVVIDWRMPTGPSAGTTAGGEITQDLTGPCTPAQIRDATALVIALSEMSTNMRLSLTDGRQLARFGFDPGNTPHTPDELGELAKLREAAEDLVAIQDLCDRQFVFPDAPTTRDRIDTRILRRLLEGKVACPPDAVVLHVNLLPAALEDPTFERLIGAEPFRFRAEQRPFGWTIDAVKGQGDLAELVFDEPIGYFFPELVADNADEVVAALRRGENARLDLRSPSRLRPRLFLPERIAPNVPLAAEPWGLLNVAEIPELRSAESLEEGP